MRGLWFHGVSTRSFKDIVAASDENYVFDLIDSNAPFALVGAGSSPPPLPWSPRRCCLKRWNWSRQRKKRRSRPSFRRPRWAGHRHVGRSNRR